MVLLNAIAYEVPNRKKNHVRWSKNIENELEP